MQEEISELRVPIKNPDVITKLTYKLGTTKNRGHTAENQIIYTEKKLKIIRVSKKEKCKSWKQLEQSLTTTGPLLTLMSIPYRFCFTGIPSPLSLPLVIIPQAF